MALSDRRGRDAAMAAYLKDKGVTPPAEYKGCGADDRALARKLGVSWMGRSSSTFERGLLGGYLAQKLGMGDIPNEIAASN